MSTFKNVDMAWVNAHNALVAKENRIPLAEASGDELQAMVDKAKGVARESDLHDQIIAECRRRGWFYVHSRMDRRTTNTRGSADFIIYGEVGGFFKTPTVFTVECKKRGGKLSPAQQAMIAQLRKFRHEVSVIEDFQEFLALL